MRNADKKLIRVFFAIPIMHQLGENFLQALSPLKTIIAQDIIHWIDKNHWHVTLQFIAKLKNEDVELLMQKIANKVHLINPFFIQFESFELFPSINQPSIISVKITPHPLLSTLASLIGQEILSMGYPLQHHPFRPHLTVGRIKNPALINANLLPTFEKSEQLIDSVVLYQSDSTTKTHYIPLATIKLAYSNQ